MRICGVKLTHDGGVSLIDDGRLVFSIEMEKLNNAPRHSRLSDLGTIFEMLLAYGYSPGDVDEFVFDGWRRTEKVRQLHGQDITIHLAPYRRGIVRSGILDRYQGRLQDIDYSSYYHYSAHAVGSYCASPFAAKGASSWVLVWDGAMFPFLYHLDPKSSSLKSAGPVLPLLGNAYHELALRLPPFDTGIAFPATLSVPGKMMALIARGRVQDDLLNAFENALDDVQRPIRSSFANDADCQEPLGQKILENLLGRIELSDCDPVDALASWHHFLGRQLIRGLRDIISRSADASDNLIFCGGCALNIKWNSDLRSSGLFSNVWVPPFPNDSGSALGAAACALVRAEGLRPIDWSVYAGPKLSRNGVLPGWEGVNCSPQEVALLLATTGEPVVFVDDNAEIGPRALGNRSILASATSAAMKSHLNAIKRREDYRPVAPICLEEHASDVFDLDEPDPFMTFECKVRSQWLHRIPAIVHEDGTARVQTVGTGGGQAVRAVLEEYYRLTGIPVLCNTSANEAGCGFFCDDTAAMKWGKTNYVWASGRMYIRTTKIRSYAAH